MSPVIHSIPIGVASSPNVPNGDLSLADLSVAHSCSPDHADPTHAALEVGKSPQNEELSSGGGDAGRPAHVGIWQRMGLSLSPWLLTSILLAGGCSKQEPSSPDHAIAGNVNLTVNPKVSEWWTGEVLDRFIELSSSAPWISVKTQEFEMGYEIGKKVEPLEVKIRNFLSKSAGGGVLVELPQIIHLGKFGSVFNSDPRICGTGKLPSEALCGIKAHMFVNDPIFHREEHRTIRSQFIWYTLEGQGLVRRMLVPPRLPAVAPVIKPEKSDEQTPATATSGVERAVAGNLSYWPHPKSAEWWTADTLEGLSAAAAATTFVRVKFMEVFIDLKAKQDLDELAPRVNELLKENPGKGVLVELPQYTYPDTELVTALPPRVVDVNDSVISAFCDGKATPRLEMPKPEAGTYSYARSQFLWYTGDGKVVDTKLVAAPPCGNRTLELPTGRYTGNVYRGQASGYGTFVRSDGSKYFGEFQANKPSGRGKEVFASGEVYEGEFRNGVKNGVGKYTFKDGLIYEGSFIADRPQGRGSLTGFSDGRSVTGTFEGSINDGDVVLKIPAQGGIIGSSIHGHVRDGKWTGHIQHLFDDGAHAEFDLVDGKIKNGKFWTKEGNGPLPFPPPPDIRSLLREAFPDGIPIGIGIGIPLGGGGGVTIRTSVGADLK
ncbi:MAG: hypothetical protein K1X79_02830 [Oligoflexia bacterium]|nr:hypothetical protein [Oligoflexia bacterium]